MVGAVNSEGTRRGIEGGLRSWNDHTERRRKRVPEADVVELMDEYIFWVHSLVMLRKS